MAKSFPSYLRVVESVAKEEADVMITAQAVTNSALGISRIADSGSLAAMRDMMNWSIVKSFYAHAEHNKADSVIAAVKKSRSKITGSSADGKSE